MGLEFTSHTQHASLHNPLQDFEEETVEVEVRRDPLTDRRTRIVREGFVMPEEDPDIDHVLDTEGCFFCPDMVEDATPTYADVEMDRGSVGDAVSFPNLNPYAAHSNVVVLTEEHYASPSAFAADELTNGLVAALEYVAAVEETDPDATYASINMNFLPPAASSIYHPHLQAIVDETGTERHRRLVDAARAYRSENDETCWDALLEQERDGPRYVGSTGSVEWLAPFAPVHQRHVRGILPDRPATDDDAVADLAAGIVAVLEYYADAGHNSFNFSWFVAPDGSSGTIVDVVARSVFDKYYTSDTSYLAILHHEPIVDVMPEECAEELRGRL